MKEDKKQPEKEKTDEKLVANKPQTVVKKPYESEFKRRYFDYYDDVKTSDRQDW